jgi:hypothetical protein
MMEIAKATTMNKASARRNMCTRPWRATKASMALEGSWVSNIHVWVLATWTRGRGVRARARRSCKVPGHPCASAARHGLVDHASPCPAPAHLSSKAHSDGKEGKEPGGLRPLGGGR